MYHPRGLFVTIMRIMIVKFLRSSYRSSDQSFALRVILKTVLDEQRREFREDNEATTLSFVADQLVRSSKVEVDWPITQSIMDVVGETGWRTDFTNNGLNTYIPYCCKSCGQKIVK